MRWRRLTLSLCLALSLASISASWASSVSTSYDPLSIVLPNVWVGDIDRVGFNEPSGVVFHPGRGTLFAVGDEGDICEIERDGALVKQTRVRPADFEGITCDPATGLLYVGIEGEEKILELSPDDFAVRREFDIERVFKGAQVLKAGGQGIEAITFLPNVRHPEGGTFLVANQGFDLRATEDVSAIFEIEVPLKTSAASKASARIVRRLPLPLIDISDMYYDSTRDLVYVISDVTNTLFEMTREGKALRSYALPGDNQEGFTVDPDGFIYIAQDSGGIIKLKWTR
jgi:hypothetical protein